ncbi:hypothetical protein LTS17_001584 [Exophiala oligosperma]
MDPRSREFGTAPVQPGEPPPDTDSNATRKRRKAVLACDPCRLRHLKCDALYPVCRQCLRRQSSNLSCTYQSPSLEILRQKEYIATLQNRIEELERGNRQLNGLLTSPETGNKSHEPRATATLGSTEHEFATQQTDMATWDPLQPQHQGESSPVDAMGANSTVQPDGQAHDSRYYGSSSAVSFMQQVYETIPNGNSSNAPDGSVNHPPLHHPDARGSRFWTLKEQGLSPLFPRSLMDTALNSYWNRVYPLYPFIHKPTFIQSYEQLWDLGSEPNTPEAGLGGSAEYGPRSIVFHCALNVMLALATQFMDMPLDDRRRLEEAFANKAKDLCRLDLFDDGSLAVIQTLLIMTQYLQCTPHPNRCWNCIGITCRLAQSLGLHIETPQVEKLTGPFALEMRRRVWYGCVTLDAVVSMTLGRPLMLANPGNVPLPQAVDDYYLERPNGQPSGWLSTMAFFAESVKLYLMLGQIVSQIYAPTPGPLRSSQASGKTASFTNFGDFAFIQRMDTDIAAFEANMPHYLHWDRRHRLAPGPFDAHIFKMQASVLYARYLHLRILLYRPMFIQYCQHVCSQAEEDERDSRFHAKATEVSLILARGLSKTCVENSIGLVEQVHARSTTTATGAWWYNLYYARTAGLVVLMAMACDPIIDVVGWSKLTESWNKCKAALSALLVFSPAAVRCLRGLEKLHEHIIGSKQGQRLAHEEPLPGRDADEDPLHDAWSRNREDGPQSHLPDHDLEPGAAASFLDDLGSLEWPNEMEASMLEGIFSFDLFE